MFWKSRLFLIQEHLKVIRFFYFRSFVFFLADFALGISYFFVNPYCVCRRFFQKKGEKKVHVYGETPLTLWAAIVKKAEITRNDRLIDLGCGRGRLCFWTSLFIGCSTIGVDWVPSFVNRGCFWARFFRIAHLRFHCTGISRASLSDATVVYLYTYHPDEEKIDFQQMRTGCRVITVSEPLLKKGFVIDKSMSASFPWGDTEIFINKKI